MRLHRHKCNRVGKRFEHRLMYMTLVVRRCSWSIRCPSCPIHWGSRRSWFCQRHLGVSQRHILYRHLLWSFLLLGNIFRQNKHCNELRWVHQQQTNIDHGYNFYTILLIFEELDLNISRGGKLHTLNYHYLCSNQRCNLYKCFDHTCSLSLKHTVHRLCV